MNIVKNKLTCWHGQPTAAHEYCKKQVERNGWHGMVNCELDYLTAMGMKDEDNTRRREYSHTS